MKINIFHFSQTGNTRKVANAMKAYFEEMGKETQMISFNKASQQDFTTADLIGIGTPCFNSQAPAPVRKYLNALPSLEGKKAFVFSTSGGAPGRVLYDITKLLQKSGADVIGGFLCRGTISHPAPCLVRRFPNRPNKHDLEKAKDFAASVLDYFSDNKTGPLLNSRPDVFKHGFGFYNILATTLKDPLIRALMPMPKVVVPEKCNECRWCEHECPTNSIKLSPKPKIENTCIRCYRCMTGCPEQALEVNWLGSNFLVWTLYSPTFERWLGDVESGEKIY
jgi:flavodoxin/NAD-dependent dihydropyrimidine dehydrogenase PreA subunit